MDRSRQRVAPRLALLVALALPLVATAGVAGDYSLDRYTLDAGGGAGGGGIYELRGTIGQPGCGLQRAGSYALYGGFWFRSTVVQRGDCNADHSVNAGDISALVLEIFDGDGEHAGDAGGSAFGGDGVGCDPNADGVVDAGDLSCIILEIFNGLGSC